MRASSSFHAVDARESLSCHALVCEIFARAIRAALGISTLMSRRDVSPKQFATRLGLFYGALFVVYGMHVPYMPVWLDWRGLSASEISTIMAAPLFLRVLLTPGVALIADRNGTHRGLLIGLAWLSLVLVLGLSQAETFWPILMLAVALVICNSTIMPLTETLAVSGVRAAGLDYGRMRLWGSLSFIAASFAGGMAVAAYGGGVGVWLIAIGCLVTAIAAHMLPSPMAGAVRSARLDVPIWKAAEPRALLAQPAFVMFLLAAGGVPAAHATFMTFGTLIWQSQGLSGTWIGALWAIGVFAEVALFAVSGVLVQRFGVPRLLVLAISASIFRWVVMAMEPGLPVLIPLQMLHGVTYGVSHIAAMHFVHQAVPAHAAGSAQALYSTVATGLAMGFATLLAGWLYTVGGAKSYLAMAVVSVLALMAALRLQHIWHGGLLIAETVADAPATIDNVVVADLAPEPRIGG